MRMMGTVGFEEARAGDTRRAVFARQSRTVLRVWHIAIFFAGNQYHRDVMFRQNVDTIDRVTLKGTNGTRIELV